MKRILSRIILIFLIGNLLPLHVAVASESQDTPSSKNQIRENRETSFQELELQQKSPAKTLKTQSVGTSGNQDAPNYVEGEVIVKYKNPTGSSTASKNLSAYDLKLEKALKKDSLFLLSESSGKTTKQIISELRSNPDIEYIQPNFIYTSTALPNDPSFNQLWGLHNTGQSVNSDAGTQDNDIDWLEMTDVFPGFNSGDKVIVAVSDRGVNYNHPDLQNNMWDGSNCVDETGAPLGGCIHGYDFEDGDKDPYPTTNDHGVHVAGTIAASMNNNEGIVGVAPGTEIMAIKGFQTSAMAVNSVNFAKHNGAKIINASWGGYFLYYHDCTDVSATPDIDQALYDAIQGFKNSGGLFVAAAGNGNPYTGVGYDHENPSTRIFPSGYATDFSCSGQNFTGLDNIISVAAVDNDGVKGVFSDYGANSVHVGAPGVEIYSTSEVTLYFEDTEYITFDSFSSYSTGNVVPDWLTGTGNIGIGDVFGSQSLSLDIANPYATGSTVIAQSSGSIDLSSVSTGTLDFWVDCDIPSGEDGDYLALEFSSDGTNFNEIKRWDHQASSYSFGLYGTGGVGDDYTYDYWDTFETDIDLATYGTSNFAYQFKWVSDGDNDRGAGCAIDLFDFHTDNVSQNTSDRYVYKDGTSMASPHVAGLASLIWKYDDSLSYTQVKDVILNTGDAKPSLSGATISGKSINAYSAIESLRSVGKIQVEMIPTAQEIDKLADIEVTIFDEKDVLYTSFSGVLDITADVSWASFSGGLSSGNISFNGNQNGSSYFTGGLLFTEIGNYEITVKEQQTGGVEGSLTGTTLAKTIPQPTGVFLSGAITNQLTTPFQLTSSEYPVTYTLTGDIGNAHTDSLISTGVLDIELTPGDGIKNISIILTDADGNTGTGASSITLDTVAPTLQITSQTGTGEVSQSIDFSFLTSDTDLDITSINWSNNINTQASTATGYSVSGSTSNALVASVSYSDLAGNTGSVSSASYKIDNTPPLAPTSLILNNNTLINIANKDSVTLGGSAAADEVGGTLHYRVLDSLGGDIEGELILSGTGFTSSNLDISGLADGNLTPSAYIVDIAGNTGATLSGANVIKETSSPEATLVILSGATTNTLDTSIQLISSEYPVNYTVTGDLIQTYTGSLSGTGNITVSLSSGEGIKDISAVFTDGGGNQSNTATKSITLDQTPPLLSVVSHEHGEKVQGETLLFTGSATDANGIESLTINNSTVTLSGNSWSKSISLTGGINTITTSLSDTAGNMATGSIDIIRVPQVSDISSSAIGTGSFQLDFSTDIPAISIIHYGTDQGNLDNTLTGSTNAINHSVVIQGLTEDTLYYYSIDTLYNTYTGIPTDVQNTKTPKSMSVNASCGSGGIFTGTIVISGDNVTSNGFTSHCEEEIKVVSTQGHSVTLDLKDLTLATSGWDKLLSPPKPTAFSGAFTHSGYSHETDLTYAIGNDDASLSFSGNTIQVTLDVGSTHNQKTLSVFRSGDNGSTYQYIDECQVTNEQCTFTTNNFSTFTLATPTDVTPDAFSFSDVSNIAPNTSITSDSITISGINTLAPISITGGQYSVNSGSLTSANGNIKNGDSVTVTASSSPSSLGVVDVVVMIGTASDTFSITTQQIRSSGGGGGGGGGGGTPTCKDVNLECQLVPGTEDVYRFYRKQGVSCRSGNLGETCKTSLSLSQKEVDKETVEVETTSEKDADSTSLEKLSSLPKIEFQTIKGKVIYTNYKNTFQLILDKIEGLSYISANIEKLSEEAGLLYINFSIQAKKLDTALSQGDEDRVSQHVSAILNIQEEFRSLEKQISGEEQAIQSLYLEGKKEYYIQYHHPILGKIQRKLRYKIFQKEDSLEVFHLENQLMYILSQIVDTESKTELEKLKKEGLQKYIELLGEYRNLKKKQRVISKPADSTPTTTENTSPVTDKKQVTYEVISHAVKLKSDTDFQYLSAWLKSGDVVELVEDTHHEYIKVKIVESYLERYVGREGYVYKTHLKKID